MKYILSLLLLGTLTLGQAQKIKIDPSFTRHVAAPASEVFTTQGYGAGQGAWPFMYISYEDKLPSLISFRRKEGKYEEKVTVVVNKNKKSFTIQYILYNAANPKGVWFATGKEVLTLNKPFALGAVLAGRLSFTFSGTITNAAGQPENVSGTVSGTFGGTVGAK